MLRRLLSLMSGSSLLTEAELADKLEVSLGELEGMLAHLVELGYVEDLAATMSAASAGVASCADAEGARLRGGLAGGSACRGCPMRGSCHGGAARKVYSLTPKGRAASEGSGSHFDLVPGSSI
jgi:hypothetical protein